MSFTFNGESVGYDRWFQLDNQNNHLHVNEGIFSDGICKNLSSESVFPCPVQFELPLQSPIAMPAPFMIEHFTPPEPTKYVGQKRGRKKKIYDSGIGEDILKERFINLIDSTINELVSLDDTTKRPYLELLVKEYVGFREEFFSPWTEEKYHARIEVAKSAVLKVFDLYQYLDILVGFYDEVLPDSVAFHPKKSDLGQQMRLLDSLFFDLAQCAQSTSWGLRVLVARESSDFLLELVHPERGLFPCSWDYLIAESIKLDKYDLFLKLWNDKIKAGVNISLSIHCIIDVREPVEKNIDYRLARKKRLNRTSGKCLTFSSPIKLAIDYHAYRTLEAIKTVLQIDFSAVRPEMDYLTYAIYHSRDVRRLRESSDVETISENFEEEKYEKTPREILFQEGVDTKRLYFSHFPSEIVSSSVWPSRLDIKKFFVIFGVHTNYTLEALMENITAQFIYYYSFIPTQYDAAVYPGCMTSSGRVVKDIFKDAIAHYQIDSSPRSLSNSLISRRIDLLSKLVVDSYHVPAAAFLSKYKSIRKMAGIDLPICCSLIGIMVILMRHSV